MEGNQWIGYHCQRCSHSCSRTGIDTKQRCAIQDEPLTLPELDFEIAEAGYSFINEVKQDIKNDNEYQNNKLEERHQQYQKKRKKF